MGVGGPGAWRGGTRKRSEEDQREKETETQAGNGGHVAERRNNGAKKGKRECRFCERDEENS